MGSGEQAGDAEVPSGLIDLYSQAIESYLFGVEMSAQFTEALGRVMLV